ncbi:Type II secretion system protein [Lentibacillus sp. JNUCC-1]|uniref:competence type IV pilus major pilin ComGC n=1 Tax=Lentibacillus sp. JNUCC-1 TaxID=2654513 RepID=UPI0012E82D10|nr:competence type IV pilus major pilin ComGC [Lentibacillus sp. JNUCC-1]MUV39649.1 Type II secretion system protein [Lentibacillus sp. JNUCC-1]
MLKNEKGFTLIEMLIVLMVISVLLILIVPNLLNRGENVQEKGCKALVAVVQAQVDQYTIEKSEKPRSLQDLVTHNYINKEQRKCGNGKVLTLSGGNVTAGGS